MTKVFSPSIKLNGFTESVIREMSRIAHEHNAINLAQGLPDFNANQLFKDAAIQAIQSDFNQYSNTWGNKKLRQAIADKYKDSFGSIIDCETNITITCGATEAMMATFLAIMNEGDEVIIFEPYYENYNPDTFLANAKPQYVRLNPPDWSFCQDELASAFNNKTKAIIINTPHNPTGKIFSSDELKYIAQLCQKWGVIAITDEIYEHIIYDDFKHTCMAALPGMKDLTITINSLSKTFSLTGWRIGWAIANQSITNSIRKVHDFLTIAAPSPLQQAAVSALSIGCEFYDELKLVYSKKRNKMMSFLDENEIDYFTPQGAYYIFADISKYGYNTDIEFCKKLVSDVKIAAVPGSSFISSTDRKNNYIRLCFSRKDETLELANDYMKKFNSVFTVT